MPVQSINQKTQPVTVQPNNINLSPDEFSKLLENLKNPQKDNTQAPSKAGSVPVPPVATTPAEKPSQVKRTIKYAPVTKAPSKSQPATINKLETKPKAPVKALITRQPEKTIELETKANAPITTPVTSLPDKNIVLGTIDKDNPTVSQLLKNNPSYKKDTWNIIFSEINKAKEFKRIPAGTVVSINTETNELIWKGVPPRNQPIPIPTDITNENITKDGQIIIGEISKANPTVSHLLKRNSFYGDYTWRIIFTDTNKNKPYRSLSNGKIVTINPQTYELSFLNKKDLPPSKKFNAAAARTFKNIAADYFNQDKDFSKKLSESVKTYIGTPYNKIDCYGLLVRGITNQGINYNESGGIRERMEKLAIEHGLPLNAYQNGEGRIETSGTKIYGQSYANVNDATSQAEQVFSEIMPILKEGEILSFSTPSSGHTGIISRKNNDWTYVNSGLMDNQVDSGVTGRRVGEELLKDELENWFVLAKSKNESLKISIGLLDEEKLNQGNRLFAQSNL